MIHLLNPLRAFSLSSLLVIASTAAYAQTNTFPATGRAGIGTTQPLEQLDIRGGSILLKNLDNTDNESVIMIGQSLSFGNYSTHGTSLRSFTESAGSNRYALQFFTQESHVTGQTEKMRIAGNGNVSIGTGTTDAKLSVAGDLQDANHGTLILGNTNHSNLRFGNHQEYSWMQSHSGKPLQINPLGNTLILNLQGGNVGIGYANPFEKLSVNGKILATEVKVAAVSNWPDYVFNPGYKRMTLPETAAFIREHGHLPEVPSAAKVEKDGLELGSMNKILLKKIEELTLELIQKDQQLKA